MDLFNFDISKSLVKIKLAMIYEPKILENSIAKRPFNGFLYILNGTYSYRYKLNSKKEILCASGESLIYLPAGCQKYDYTVTSDSQAPAKSMQIEFEIKDAVSGMPLSFSSVPILLDAHLPKIKEAFINVINLYSSVSCSERYMAYSEFIRLISYLSSSKRLENKAGSNKIMPAIKHIEQNYTLKIHSDKLAKLCTLSKSQLRRCFKSELGISPKSYQNELIFKSAKDLLRVGEFNISEISEMLGFSDVYAFSHFFAKKSGYSPSEFVRRTKEVSDA